MAVDDAAPWNVYVICEEGCSETGPCKIGTARVVAYRIDSLRGGNPRPLVLLRALKVRSRWRAYEIERAIHLEFDAQRMRGRDWFNIEPIRLVGLVDKMGADQ